MLCKLHSSVNVIVFILKTFIRLICSFSNVSKARWNFQFYLFLLLFSMYYYNVSFEQKNFSHDSSVQMFRTRFNATRLLFRMFNAYFYICYPTTDLNRTISFSEFRLKIIIFVIICRLIHKIL